MPDQVLKYGLIGFPLGHSFSKNFYDNKFKNENIEGVQYSLYEIPEIRSFPAILKEESTLMGVNVTIPHKVAVMDFVDDLSPEALAVGAVNCIRIDRKQGEKPYLTGYNTDVYGFVNSLKPLLKPWHTHALILGNGGAAKAVRNGLLQLGISFQTVSRQVVATEGFLTYGQLTEDHINNHYLIINTTPLGTFPDISSCPDIPYSLLTEKHLLYDLVYNPEKTTFLQKGEEKGSTIKNGYEMLVLQAERNWEVWIA